MRACSRSSHNSVAASTRRGPKRLIRSPLMLKRLPRCTASNCGQRFHASSVSIGRLPCVAPMLAVRIRSDDGFGRNGRHQQGLARKHIAAAAQRQHVREDVLAVERHQRLFPYLVEHRNRRPARVALAQCIGALAELLGRVVRAGTGVEQRTECLDRARNIAHAMRLGEEQRNAQRTQPVDLLLRVTVTPDHHQIGLEGGNALQIERAVIAHVRNVARGWRVVAVSHGADDACAAAGREQQLGRMRRETDDALRGALQRNGGTAIVCDGNGGKCRCGSDRERNGGEAARTQATGETR